MSTQDISRRESKYSRKLREERQGTREPFQFVEKTKPEKEPTRFVPAVHQDDTMIGRIAKLDRMREFALVKADNEIFYLKFRELPREDIPSIDETSEIKFTPAPKTKNYRRAIRAKVVDQ